MHASSSATATSNTTVAALMTVVLDQKIKKPRRQIVVFENINLGIENGGLLNDIWTPN